MNPTMLIIIGAGIVGGAIGWFTRGRFFLTIPFCIVAPILFIAAMMYLSYGPQKGYPSGRWLAELCHAIYPFLSLAAPCLVAGVLMTLVVRHRAKKAKA